VSRMGGSDTYPSTPAEGPRVCTSTYQSRFIGHLTISSASRRARISTLKSRPRPSWSWSRRLRASYGGSRGSPSCRASNPLQVGASDAQMDALVYELYGLTEEEIPIVSEPSEK
jgi:hypothetical protein